jgi:hypothetical protein
MQQFQQYKKPPPDHRILKQRDADQRSERLTAHLKARIQSEISRHACIHRNGDAHACTSGG